MRFLFLALFLFGLNGAALSQIEYPSPKGLTESEKRFLEERLALYTGERMTLEEYTADFPAVREKLLEFIRQEPNRIHRGLVFKTLLDTIPHYEGGDVYTDEYLNLLREHLSPTDEEAWNFNDRPLFDALIRNPDLHDEVIYWVKEYVLYTAHGSYDFEAKKRLATAISDDRHGTHLDLEDAVAIQKILQDSDHSERDTVMLWSHLTENYGFQAVWKEVYPEGFQHEEIYDSPFSDFLAFAARTGCEDGVRKGYYEDANLQPDLILNHFEQVYEQSENLTFFSPIIELQKASLKSFEDSFHFTLRHLILGTPGADFTTFKRTFLGYDKAILDYVEANLDNFSREELVELAAATPDLNTMIAAHLWKSVPEVHLEEDFHHYLQKRLNHENPAVRTRASKFLARNVSEISLHSHLKLMPTIETESVEARLWLQMFLEHLDQDPQRRELFLKRLKGSSEWASPIRKLFESFAPEHWESFRVSHLEPPKEGSFHESITLPPPPSEARLSVTREIDPPPPLNLTSPQRRRLSRSLIHDINGYEGNLYERLVTIWTLDCMGELQDRYREKMHTHGLTYVSLRDELNDIMHRNLKRHIVRDYWVPLVHHNTFCQRHERHSNCNDFLTLVVNQVKADFPQAVIRIENRLPNYFPPTCKNQDPVELLSRSLR